MPTGRRTAGARADPSGGAGHLGGSVVVISAADIADIGFVNGYMMGTSEEALGLHAETTLGQLAAMRRSPG